MKGFFLAASIIVLPWPVYALSCADLKTPENIRTFIENSKATNPLWRDNLSVQLEISPCEKDECSKANRGKRKAKIQNLHVVRLGENHRALIMKGPKTRQCLIKRGNREFLCAECRRTTNFDCRSFVTGDSATRIAGTNIDTSDFDLITHDNYETVCRELAKTPKYLKLTSTLRSGEGHYETIVSFYEKRREIPITINYFFQGSLRKVYRFFPKYYVKIEKQWIATIIRARTTRGSEKRYFFETQVRVMSKDGTKYLLYFNPKDDLELKGQPIDKVFDTN